MPDPNQQVQTPPAQAAPTAAPETITFDTPVAAPAAQSAQSAQPVAQPETIKFDSPAVPVAAISALNSAPEGATGAEQVVKTALDPKWGWYGATADALKKTFFSPETASTAPLPEQQQHEVSGISDIAHGDVSKGLGEVWDSERPHVIPGSPLERAIQVVNPNFRGEAPATTRTVSSRPNIDIAQFIDKSKHPIGKAIAEMAQGATSLDNVSIMLGTGGLGLVDSPLALAKANRLINGGFSASTIGSAYKNLKGFKEAYDNNDMPEAEHQLTLALGSGVISALAGYHAATGKQLPVFSEADKKVAGAAGNAASAVGGKIADTGQALVNVAKDTLSNTKKAVGVGDSFKELVRRTSKPSKGAAAEYDKTLDAAIPQLTEIAKANPNVSTPQEYVEAIQQHIDTKENDLRDQARKLQGATGEPEDKAILTDADKQVSDALDDYFKEHTGAYKPEQIQAAKNEVLDRVRQGAGEEPRNPSLFEAENLRRQLNKETAPMFGSDTSVPNAVRDGKMVANAVLRNLIDGKFDDLGVKNVQEWRKQESALIDVKDQLSKAFQKASDMGQFNIVQAAIKKSGWALAGSFLGHAPGALGGEALGVAQEYINDRLTNPNRLIERAVKTAGESKAPTGAINPSKTPAAPGSMQVKLPVEVEENPNIPGQASEPGSIKSIVENAGGVFKGNKEGLVEITLPESMTSKLNISEPLKKFVSVTIPEEKVTPEFVKRAINNKLKEFGGTPEPTIELVHKTGDVNQVTARNEDGRNMGTVKYVLSPDKSTASITAAYLDPLFRNQGAGQKMYLRAITEAKNAGAKEITSDLQGSTNLDASRVWEALKKKGYDVESTPTKAGSQGYRLDLASVDDAGNPKVKAENPAVNVAPEKVEEKEPVDAYHPDLQKVADKYGVSTDASKAENGASFIAPDGKFIHLPNTHDDALASTIGDNDRASFIQDTGAVRTRFSKDRAGRTLHVSVPADGITPDQIDSLKSAVKDAVGRNGNIVMEVAEVNGKSAEKQFASANDIEPMLKEIGAHPDNGWDTEAGESAAKQDAGGIDPKTGQSDTKGIGTEIMPELRQALDHAPTAEDFKNFYDQHKDIFDQHPELRVGWDNNSKLPGGHEINVGAVGPNAAAVAAKLDQRSAYDIAKGEEIPTGGQVLKSDFPDYPIEDRLAELHELPVPKKLMPEKMTYPQLRAHELGHAIVADALGVTPTVILSHLGSRSGTSAAEAEVDFSSLGADKDGYFNPITLRNAIDKLATISVAGVIAENIVHGTPVPGNPSMAGDMRMLTTALRNLGFQPAEAVKVLESANQKARDILTKPGLSDIVKSEAKNRQPGLDEKYQIGPERLKEIIQKVKGLNNEGNTKGTSQQDNGVVSKADRGTKGKSTKRSKEESAKIKSGSDVLGG